MATEDGTATTEETTIEENITEITEEKPEKKKKKKKSQKAAEVPEPINVDEQPAIDEQTKNQENESKPVVPRHFMYELFTLIISA